MINLSELIAGHHAEGLPVRVARPLHAVIALACAVLLLAMMGLTVADVLGRYLFNAPIKGATELTELMLAATIFLGLPAATMDREHVTVDLLTDRLSGLFDRLRRPVILLATAAVQLLIGWRIWVTAMEVASYGGTTPSLELPVAPVGFLAAMLCAVSALVMLAQIFYRPAKEN